MISMAMHRNRVCGFTLYVFVTLVYTTEIEVMSLYFPHFTFMRRRMHVFGYEVLTEGPSIVCAY